MTKIVRLGERIIHYEYALGILQLRTLSRKTFVHGEVVLLLSRKREGIKNQEQGRKTEIHGSNVF
jgi:hypothetical protein